MKKGLLTGTEGKGGKKVFDLSTKLWESPARTTWAGSLKEEKVVEKELQWVPSHL